MAAGDDRDVARDIGHREKQDRVARAEPIDESAAGAEARPTEQKLLTAREGRRRSSGACVGLPIHTATPVRRNQSEQP